MLENAKKRLLAIAPPVIAISVIAALFASLLTLAGYPAWLQELGYQQACHSQFGQNATFAGEVGQGFGNGGNGIYCLTDDGLKATSGGSAPANLETFKHYIGDVLAGKT